MRANPEDASWGLSEPKVIALWPNLNGGPIVHLSWGPASSELAAIDAVGRVFLLSFNSDLNRPMISRRWDTDPIDDLHTIVGTYWLNQLPANTRVWFSPLDLHHSALTKTPSSILHIPPLLKMQRGQIIRLKLLGFQPWGQVILIRPNLHSFALQQMVSLRCFGAKIATKPKRRLLN